MKKHHQHNMQEWLETSNTNKGMVNKVTDGDLNYISNQSIHFVKNCIEFSEEVSKGTDNVMYKYGLLNWCLNWLQRQEAFIIEDGKVKQDINLDISKQNEIVEAVKNIAILNNVDTAANITFGGLGVAATLVTLVIALPAAPFVGAAAAGALAAAPAVTAVAAAAAPIVTNLWFGLGLIGAQVGASKTMDLAIKNEKGIPIEIAFKTEDLNTLLEVTLKLVKGVEIIHFWKDIRS